MEKALDRFGGLTLYEFVISLHMVYFERVSLKEDALQAISVV